MEQACKWVRTLYLPGGCENLGADRDTVGNVSVTSIHDGAERDQTWGGAGVVQPVLASARNLEVGPSLEEDGGFLESSGSPVAVTTASRV
jgi:hypothetical protein